MMGFENQGLEEPHLDPSQHSSNGSKLPFEDPLSSFVEIPTDDSDPLYSPPLEEAPSPSQSSINSILEPPSYAEAVFRSFDTNPVGSADSNGQDSFKGEFLRISVSDPQREHEESSILPGGNTYYSYLVTTFTNLSHFDGSEFNVRRRFRDFVALADRLGSVFRGFFVPMRPDKSVVESQVMQKSDFVEQRRADLERYLMRLAAHPAIRRSEEFRVFLVGQGKMPPLLRESGVSSRGMEGGETGSDQMVGEEGVGGGGVDVSEVALPSKGGWDFMKTLKELKQSVTNDWGGAKPPIVEEDKEFLEKKEKLQDFEVQLSAASQQAESLVKAQQDIGETIGQLGLAFVKLTKFETEEAIYDSQRERAADMKNVATAAVKASRLYRELNSQTVKHLDKLHEYLGVMLAVNNAFSDRASALLSVQTLLSDLSSLNSRIEKLEAASSKIFGGDRTRIRKIEELRETLRVTEDAKNSAVREYEKIKENNRNELERLDKEKHDDFVSMLKGFIVNQAGYAEKMANVWETVAEETSRYVKN